jgi:hypothetical protein
MKLPGGSIPHAGSADVPGAMSGCRGDAAAHDGYPPPVTISDDRGFPDALAAAMAVEFDYADGEGVDFEPFPAFLSAKETTDWFRDWTGNKKLRGDDFRVFGQDGTGGYAAVWLIRPGQALVDQPVVFLGSEGETGVVARHLGDFLWLLAGGIGPCEALSYEADQSPRPNQDLTVIAQRFAPGPPRSAAAVLEEAAEEFPDFDERIAGLCR